MKFWCFNFEGFFEDDAPQWAGQGVFSGCLVQAGNYTDAEFTFLEALTERKINLIEIQEEFPVDTHPDEMDPEIDGNLFWIEWCEEVELSGKPVFEEFILYPAEDVPEKNRKDS